MRPLAQDPYRREGTSLLSLIEPTFALESRIRTENDTRAPVGSTEKYCGKSFLFRLSRAKVGSINDDIGVSFIL